jgi:D-hexose-6-phosphate mutarotase
MDPLAPFLVPGRVEPARHGDLPFLRLDAPASSIEITPHGAHVLHWQPHGHQPVLFTSARSAFTPGKPIRGGVPIVFPWFGACKAASGGPSHGFARQRAWEMVRAEVRGDAAEAELRLVHDDPPSAAWPHPFEARFLVRAGTALHLRLVVRNPAEAPFSFDAALHTYFLVSDIRHAAVHGLEHADFLDYKDGGRRKNQGGEPVRFGAETDRVYPGSTAACTIDDPGWRRRIVVAKAGSRTTVVWNPWIAKAQAMPDFGDDEWPSMVCVETANAFGDSVTLAPGHTHALEAAITVQALP